MDGDKARHAVLSKRNRQVLDALRQGPVYCASPVRLSDKVLILKRDYGLDIETIRIDGDEEGRFGVYRLVSAVRLVRDATKKAEAA
ncbi:hypothetical protein [Wenxinia saemankumensis]|nr:hypothetical protein [Wenxinia saemankumensis]